MKHRIVPLILAGGSGSRLWPLSRSLHPKQFWSLHSELSMLQNTLERSSSAALSDLEVLNPIIICNHVHRHLLHEQCNEIGISPLAVLLEPVSRNTAPAIALAAAYVEKLGIDNAMILVLSSDHVIEGRGLYNDAIVTAAELGAQGYLCTFGITPTHPATGYGYIEQGSKLTEGGFKIARFVEKPELRRAQQMLDQGGFRWNAGLFLFPKEVLMDELRAFSPITVDGVQKALAAATEVDGGLLVEQSSFAAIPDDSIDYCLMEKTKNGAVIASDFIWSDVGSWDAVWAISPKDALGNACQGDTFLSGVSNSLVRASGITLAVAGVEDIIVVGTKDAVLVVEKSKAQEVKKIVEQIKLSGKERLTRHHDHQLTPWGETRLLEALSEGPSVHRLTLRPGGVQPPLSEAERDTLIIVTNGSVLVTLEGTDYSLETGESLRVPAGMDYALANSSASDPANLLKTFTYASNLPASIGFLSSVGNRSGAGVNISPANPDYMAFRKTT